jgi:hypothetical protein
MVLPLIGCAACQLVFPLHHESTSGTANDGGAPCAGCVDPSSGPYNYAFITSGTYTPGATYAGNHTFLGIAEADLICNDVAKASKILPHDREYHYVAWLSDSTHDAHDRLVFPGTNTLAQGWIRPDKRPFADSLASLSQGAIYYPLRIDENGRDLIEDFQRGSTPAISVATGTERDGRRASDLAQDWKSASDSYQVGEALATTLYWTNAGLKTDSRPTRLYCFGVDVATPLKLPHVTGRRAFLSGQPFVLHEGSNRSDADAQCTAEANNHDVGGQFFALLSLGNEPATTRFPGGTPWVRTDGIPWVEHVDDLKTGQILTPLNVDVAGSTYVDYHKVWTGSGRPGDTAGPDCTDWTTATGTATYGRAGESSLYAFDEMQRPDVCSDPFVFLYCLQKEDQ